MEEHFANTEREYKNISGIKFANRSDSVTVNGKSYAAPTYNDDGSVKTGNEVLSITINKIDPKAIWNFAPSILNVPAGIFIQTENFTVQEASFFVSCSKLFKSCNQSV